MSDSVPLSDDLRQFVASCEWTFAKTYADTWPHDYIVRDRVDGERFVQLVRHIRAHGFEGRFYSQRYTYFAEDGMLYWTMEAPVEKTVIINRCREEESYESRLKNGTLPERKSRGDDRTAGREA